MPSSSFISTCSPPSTCARAGTRRRPPLRPPALRWRRQHQGRRSRCVADTPRRDGDAGRPLWAARPAQAGRLRLRRHRHDGPGHRRQYRHLQRRQRGCPAAASVCSRRGSAAAQPDAHRHHQRRILAARHRRHQARQHHPRRRRRIPQRCTSSCSAARSRSGWRQASCRGTTSKRSGVTPALGRTFRAADDAHDAPGALILSHEVPGSVRSRAALTFWGASSR